MDSFGLLSPNESILYRSKLDEGEFGSVTQTATMGGRRSVYGHNGQKVTKTWVYTHIFVFLAIMATEPERLCPALGRYSRREISTCRELHEMHENRRFGRKARKRSFRT